MNGEGPPQSPPEAPPAEAQSPPAEAQSLPEALALNGSEIKHPLDEAWDAVVQMILKIHEGEDASENSPLYILREIAKSAQAAEKEIEAINQQRIQEASQKGEQPTLLTKEEKEAIRRKYYDENATLFNQVNDQGEIKFQVDQDGNPVVDEEGKPIPVKLDQSKTIEFVISELGKIKEKKSADDQPIPEAQKAKTYLDVLDKAAIKDSEDRITKFSKEKLLQYDLGEAQKFLLSQYAEIIGNVKDYPEINDPIMTTMMIIGESIETTKPYARRMVVNALAIYKMRLERAGKTELVTKLDQHLNRLQQYPQEKSEIVSFINEIAQNVHLSEEKWNYLINNHFSLSDIVEIILQEGQGQYQMEKSTKILDQLNQALTALVSEDRLQLKNIIQRLKSDNNFQEYVQKYNFNNKQIEERVKKSLFFYDENPTNAKTRLLAAAFFLFVGLQVLPLNIGLESSEQQRSI